MERDASEEEMILEFLKAECSRPLIYDADLSDAVQNAKRAQKLDARRGYTSRTAIFRNFPREVRWRYSTLTAQDFERLRYVNSSPWRQLAGDGLRVIDGANHIKQNIPNPAVPGIHTLTLKIEAIARSIREGRDPTAALIVAEVGDGRMIVLEGNNRATAYVIANVGRPVVTLFGSSPGMVAWANQGWA
jgi:hypothetical protein